MNDLWVQIVSLVSAALVPTGGITAWFMVRGKRRELEISNLSQVIAMWKGVAEERSNRAGELKADVDKKDAKIDKLYDLVSELRTELDHERSARAAASIMICDTTKCENRNPPFGQGVEYLSKLFDLKPILPKSHDEGVPQQ